MATAEVVSYAAPAYRRNGELLKKSLAGLSREEWLRQPAEASNHLFWIVGHIMWARTAVLGMLGASWSRPWLTLFARGGNLAAADQYPSLEEINAAWDEQSAALISALENASPEIMASPAPERIPSFDGTKAGTIELLGQHEAGHVGQAIYLRSWLQHGRATS